MRQRSTEWRRARLGDVTASRFHEVLTNPSTTGVHPVIGKRGEWFVEGTGKLPYTKKADAEAARKEALAVWKEENWSASAEAYLDEKLAEMISGVPLDVWRHKATDWGMQNEPHAFEASIPVIQERFGEELSLPVDEFAYIHHPTEPYIGCSPDGVMGKDGLLEIKCPYNGAKWISMYRNGLTVPKEYVPQVQGSLWVTGRTWYAFCYYDPRVTNSGLDPLLVTRIERDDDYIDNVLAPKVLRFRDYLRAEYAKMVASREPF